MGQRRSNDDPYHENEKLVAAADFDGPTRHRRFTDLFCLLLLLAMWTCMTIMGSYAINNGDYRLVVYPLDYSGNICGTDFVASSSSSSNNNKSAVDMTDYPYLYYINSYGGGVCVKDCPVVSEHHHQPLAELVGDLCQFWMLTQFERAHGETWCARILHAVRCR